MHTSALNNDPILIPPQVEKYESQCHLPAMTGTPRQVSWARLIRQQVLSEMLPRLMDFAAKLPADKQKDTFTAVDQIRAIIVAKMWIEVYRNFRARPDALLVKLAGMMEEQRKAERLVAEKKLRAKENQRLTNEAKKFDLKHNLPPIRGASPKQESLGRRCRYSLLHKLSLEEIEQQREFLTYWTLAVTWIASAFRNETFDQFRAGHHTDAEHERALLKVRGDQQSASDQVLERPTYQGNGH